MKDVNSLLDEDKHAPALQAHCFIFTYVYYYIGLCERDPAERRGLFWLSWEVTHVNFVKNHIEICNNSYF